MIKLLLLSALFIQTSEYTVSISSPAANGVQSIRIEFPNWPKTITGILPEDAVTEEHIIDLKDEYTFYAGGSFIGLDRGDVGEYAITIACNNGPEIYERSLHKEIATSFNSIDWQYASFAQCRYLHIWLVARTTGPNDLLRPGKPWSSRPHFGVRLYTWPNKIEVTSPPPEDPILPSNIKPEDYVSRERAGEWKEDHSTGLALDLYVTLQENTWAGWRDLEYVAAHCSETAADGSEPVFTRTVEELLNLASEGKFLDQEMRSKFVPRWNEVNRRCESDMAFCGRTEFRKDVLSPAMDILRIHLAKAWEETAQLNQFPEHGVDYDTLKGFCEWKLAQ